MRPLLPALLILLAALALPARAAPPRVAADIPPVHGLVAAVMEGLGTPELLLSGGGSPHAAALRPSEARALQRAELVVWVGPELTPWLGHAINALSGQARRLTLLHLPQTQRLPARTSARFAEAGGAGGDSAPVDPHAWLDPANARVWLDAIAEALAAADPANAARYAANAEAADAEIRAAEADAQARLAPLREEPFLVFHDAFRYFEHRFGLSAAGAVSLSDAAEPGPAQLAEAAAVARRAGVRCILLEPGTSPGLLATVAGPQRMREAVVDPLGQDIATGPGHYPAHLHALAEAVAGCLS